MFQTRYLAVSGGSTVADTTRNVMKRLVTTKVAVLCNWKGKGGKHAFGPGMLKKVVCGKFTCSWHIITSIDICSVMQCRTSCL